MAAPPQRTPISLLQELCSRHGLTPDYKLLSVEGAVHAPTFMYLVQVADVSATATGQSKKKAKHSAAKSILEKLISKDGLFAENSITNDGITVSMENLDNVVSAAMSKEKQTEPDENSVAAEDDIPGNPVGTLQELCMKRRCRPPYYETMKEKGLPHERTFEIACFMNNFEEIGVGKSKRLAKRQAAQKMLTKVQDMITKGDSLNDDDDDNEMKENNNEKAFTNGYETFAQQRMAKPTANHSLLLSQFVENLKEQRENERLWQSLEVENHENHISVLKFVSEELNFEVVYTPIKESSQSNKHQCLVQLAAIPVAVCFGTGTSEEGAKQDAAHNALQYLKIIGKRRQ